MVRFLPWKRTPAQQNTSSPLEPHRPPSTPGNSGSSSSGRNRKKGESDPRPNIVVQPAQRLRDTNAPRLNSQIPVHGRTAMAPGATRQLELQENDGTIMRSHSDLGGQPAPSSNVKQPELPSHLMVDWNALTIQSGVHERSSADRFESLHPSAATLSPGLGSHRKRSDHTDGATAVDRVADDRSTEKTGTTKIETRNCVATVRVANINNSTTEEDLVNFFKAKDLELSDEHGGISLVDGDGEQKIATVSFRDEEMLQQALSLPHRERKLKDRVLGLDERFEGLTVLSGSDSSQVDIVALHGMNGHAFDSWEYRDNSGYSFMWLRDYLPQKLPNARVITYGYNANILEDVSTGRIRTYAETFLENLLRKRNGNQVTGRPLILLGHSLGGLIIKQALIIANTRADRRYASILDCVSGVIFLGTPHRGLSGIDTATFVANFIGASTGKVTVRNDLFTEQHPSSMVLFDLTDDFRQLLMAKGIEVATLFEIEKTQCQGSDPVWIVDEQSAVLGVAGERKASINANHMNLCKFEDSGDNSLFTIIDCIKEFVFDAVPRISSLPFTDLPSPPEGIKYFSDGGLFPIFIYGKYTYYAFSYIDNRYATAVYAYDRHGKIKGMWTKPGARYTHRIEYREEGSRRVAFVGQGDLAVVFTVNELKIAAM